MSTQKLKVHFIGIGGIGVSALAKYYLTKEHSVSGSDLVSSEITRTLKRSGAKIRIGEHKEMNLPKDVNLVVFSPAVRPDNPELKAARELKVEYLSYPTALGKLTQNHFTIAISGTHGKSTTTAMIGLLLTRAGLDPTVIVGTKLKEFGNSNCRVGKGKYLVIEADEHFASFLNYWPKIIVLTALEADHLDFYKTLGKMIKTFKEYVAHLPKDGFLVANKDDKNTKNVIPATFKNVKYYSLKDKERKKLKRTLKVPGEHNISNALAALTLARILKIPDRISFKTLSEYRGSWRRFEIKKGKVGKNPITVISDYGHHPTEIELTLKAVREKYPKKKIWCLYQPHQYQRTYYLFNDFVRVFRKAPVDRLILTDVYDVAGREEGRIKEKVNSKKLAKKTNKAEVIYLPKKKTVPYLRKNLKGGEILIIMGAGDIYLFVDSFSLTEKGKRRKM
jgi:UDP-N-acetylmuramate--alanine ligase